MPTMDDVLRKKTFKGEGPDLAQGCSEAQMMRERLGR
jgi:hypothetical protein